MAKRGSIAFFATYRPPVPLDIYSRPIPSKSGSDPEPGETILTDSVSYNYNGRAIPPAAIKSILNHPQSPSEAQESDVDAGYVSAIAFVSERTDNLETLHFALRYKAGATSKPIFEVFNFAKMYGIPRQVRLEDGGVFAAGDYFLYVSTHEPNPARREPWTAVYRTNLKTGDTKRLTPPGVADLSPAVSPSGKRLAVATFQHKINGWDGEIEDLQTNIAVMDVEARSGSERRDICVTNGGWPSWGSETILFFHRKEGDHWRVYRTEIIGDPPIASKEEPVTPADIDAMTPAAIDADKVAVATIRVKTKINSQLIPARKVDEYRHIEIFQRGSKEPVAKITAQTENPLADHYNPFVTTDIQGQRRRIGYHRVRTDDIKSEENDIPRQTEKILCPLPDVGLLRMPGVFPAISSDGKKVAFIDNEFKAVWVADKEGIRLAYVEMDGNQIFAPTWSQNQEEDVIYVCKGPSFNTKKKVNILAIRGASSSDPLVQQLTENTAAPLPDPSDGDNNAFPSTDPTGKRMVFRSTRGGGGFKNLYIMEDTEFGEAEGGKVTRLTKGDWIDTHCHWSPNGKWIAFSSTRDKPPTAPKDDHGLDPGYYSVYLVAPNKPSVQVRVNTGDSNIPPAVRVIASGRDGAGHANHPYFSPDGKSIVFVSDLAAVSVDPISLPIFIHSVRPYGDIFSIDIDTDNIERNENITKFYRITHSRYENSTATWTKFATNSPSGEWELQRFIDADELTTIQHIRCPYIHAYRGESVHMTGHLILPKRCC